MAQINSLKGKKHLLSSNPNSPFHSGVKTFYQNQKQPCFYNNQNQKPFKVFRVD